MASTVSIPGIGPQPQHLGGGLAVYFRDLDVTSYATGGEVITPAALGVPKIASIIGVEPRETPVFWAHDAANEKLVLHDAGGQVTATTDIGVIRLTILCVAG